MLSAGRVLTYLVVVRVSLKQGALLWDLGLVLAGLDGLVRLALLVVLGLPLARLPCVEETIINMCWIKYSRWSKHCGLFLN